MIEPTVYYWWECVCGAEGFSRHRGHHNATQARHLRAVIRRGGDVMDHDFSHGIHVAIPESNSH